MENASIEEEGISLKAQYNPMLGRVGALLVMLWFVAGVTAVAYYEVKKEATRHTVKIVTGKVKSVGAPGLVVEVSGKAGKEYTIALTETTIKMGENEGASTDLKEGDAVRVAYTESKGQLIAKTVIAEGREAKKK